MMRSKSHFVSITFVLVCGLFCLTSSKSFAEDGGIWRQLGKNTDGSNLYERNDGQWCSGFEGPECGGGDPPPCYTHDCTVPDCPTNTIKYNTGYATGYLVSCDRGCGQRSSNMCYEIPTTCDPQYQDCEDEYKNSTIRSSISPSSTFQ